MAIKFTDEQLDLKELAREFFEKEVKPVMAEIDSRPNAKDCYPAELVRKASHIGLRTLPLPDEYEGVDADIVTQCLVFSTMCEIEPGLAKVLSQCWKIAQSILVRGTEMQKKKFLGEFAKDHDYVFSVSKTEPNAAGDNFLPYDGVEGGLKITAVPDGEYFVINGSKNMSSLAGYSKCIALHARTDRTVASFRGTSFFLVPHDLPGISYGQVHNKMGYRLYPNGEIFFDKVRVPKEYLLGKLNDGHESFRGVPYGSLEILALTLGICRGMFNIAVDHAKQRIQGGKPIIEHESVGLMLAEIAMLIDTLEASLYDIASNYIADPQYDGRLRTRFAAVYPREVILRVIALSMDVVASAGIMRDHPMEKLIRDGLTFLHGSATASLNKLRLLPFVRKF